MPHERAAARCIDDRQLPVVLSAHVQDRNEQSASLFEHCAQPGRERALRMLQGEGEVTVGALGREQAQERAFAVRAERALHAQDQLGVARGRLRRAAAARGRGQLGSGE